MTDCCRTDHISDDDRYPPIACRAVAGRTTPAACLPEWTDTFGADCEDPYVCVIEEPSDE